ncbi:MAG: hypothetical protein HFE36_05845 [Clostridia bacterium]|nr:hypothetical protein [Clostridia bacterium]
MTRVSRRGLPRSRCSLAMTGVFRKGGGEWCRCARQAQCPHRTELNIGLSRACTAKGLLFKFAQHGLSKR